MDVATCGACHQVFDVTSDRDYRHLEVGLDSSLRPNRSINLCPPCRAAAKEHAALPHAALPEEEAHAEVPDAVPPTGEA